MALQVAFSNLLFRKFQVSSNIYVIHIQKKYKKLLYGPSQGAELSSPEQSLEVLRQLRAARVAWVHGDEDSHRRIQADRSSGSSPRNWGNQMPARVASGEAGDSFVSKHTDTPPPWTL